MLSSLRLRAPRLYALNASSVIRTKSILRCSFSALVDSKWVRNAQTSGEPELLLLDCNHPTSYLRGHIPDAVPFTMAPSLFKNHTPEATGVVSLELFCDIVQALQVPKDATLVFYDDDSISLIATRTWWVFRHFGFPLEQLKVLDGGLKQWKAEGNEVDTGEAEDREIAADLWTQPVDTQKLVGFQAVQKGIADPATQFVDTRSAGEFRGEDALDNARTGHVPGAVHFNWMEGVDFLRNGRFKTKDELEEVFVDTFRLDKAKPVITYCHRGIRAAHTAFLLEQIVGFKDVTIYEDSMREYLNRDDSEVAEQ
uniref:Rhodanese domain-containing protein n=1 Tax=Hyaloperonospora arabidopsidis (strain Emoy2) TaxID=559515 RepID=M4B8U7_HYAAE